MDQNNTHILYLLLMHFGKIVQERGEMQCYMHLVALKLDGPSTM